ncbi:MAG TPA: ABC transporter substrate-binding protein [Actinomycetota bacterium]
MADVLRTRSKTVRPGARRAALLLILVLATACVGRPPETASTSGVDLITIGSFDFSESEILAEIYAQALTLRGYRVERILRVGPRELVEPALEEGLIDLVPEYLGTALEFMTHGRGTATADVNASHQALQRELSTRGIAVLEPAPAQNANGVVVTRETADRYGLERISDLAPLASELVIGGPPECPERPLCLQGLGRLYGLRFREFVPTDAGGPLTAGFLDAGEIDVAVLFTTSGYLGEDGYVLLEDDRGLQPAENVVPVVRGEVLRRYGAPLRDLLDDISSRLEAEDLIELNRSVDLEGQHPARAASGWLTANGYAA